MKRLPLLLVAGFIGACGTTTTQMPLNSPVREMQSKPVSEVDFYTTPPNDKKYVEIMIIEIQQQSAFSTVNREQIMQEIRAKAATEGCDGIIVSENNDSMVVDGASYDQKGFKGTCIQYPAS